MVRKIGREEYNSLPEALRKQLTISASRNKEEMVLYCAELIGDSFGIDEMLISIYNEFGVILKQNTTYCLLSKLVNEGHLNRVNSGEYEIKEKQNEKR